MATILKVLLRAHAFYMKSLETPLLNTGTLIEQAGRGTSENKNEKQNKSNKISRTQLRLLSNSTTASCLPHNTK